MQVHVDSITIETEKHSDLPQPQLLETPKTSESLMSLRRQTDESITQGGELDGPCKLRIQKLANAVENAFAERAILLDENLLLLSKIS